jgi:isoleucyl-tRNA synthetase
VPLFRSVTVCADLDIFAPVTVAFPLVDDPKTSLLAWTTTPWTLPSNLGLCVHPDFNYIKIYDEERGLNFILLETRLVALYKDPKKAKFKKVGQFRGEDMRGWRYSPMFEYFTEKVLNQSFFKAGSCLLTGLNLP